VLKRQAARRTGRGPGWLLNVYEWAMDGRRRLVRLKPEQVVIFWVSIAGFGRSAKSAFDDL